ncbi:MAG: hypothetical protein JWQ25_858 [Daejeonella sp.]|nr:hypothetical protein [Daejeonella sp.]
MNNNSSGIITGNSSVFLDALRLAASLTVLYIHGSDLWFPSKIHDPSKAGNTAHFAVVVFFVLSGFVIAYTTKKSNRGATQYLFARLSRLCSVVIPALLVAAVAEELIAYYASDLTGTILRGTSWPRYLISATFLNELWFFSAAPPINLPLWSLSFEFWYYVIFGFWFYKGSGIKGLLILVLACLIAGPKILLLMPVWIMGCLAYNYHFFKIKPVTAWFIIGCILLVVVLTAIVLPPIPFGIGNVPLYYASQFITDWIIGSFIAAALWILPLQKAFVIEKRFVKSFRMIADLTFPIYVLHYPLLVLFRTLVGFRENDTLQLWEAIISVLILSGLLGVVFQSQRYVWMKVFYKMHAVIQPLVSKVYVKINSSTETG